MGLSEPNPQRDPSSPVSRRDGLKVVLASLLASSGMAPAAFGDPGLDHLPQSLARTHDSGTPLKSRAIADYQRSTASLGGRLASSLDELNHAAACDQPYDVLIIGSGYGGAVCAARLSAAMRPGTRLAVLERGREWVPGTFPDTFANLMRESRYGLFGRSRNALRNPLGLIDFTFNDEVHVMNGSGLGGGSLINAGVAVIPDAEVFQQPCWPMDLQDRDVLMPHFEAVAQMLDLRPVPCDTTKTLALRRLAARLKRPAIATPAFVTVKPQRSAHYQGGVNRFGMLQRPCELCGDCTSGCNIGAKNTLAFNYLPLARRCGAQIFTQTEVD
ncbi:MAG: GMC family oxidoreductase, partial [Planctomycetales bacterium]|nr:GMC family oxidoreductase [Planctomycetales bacterium]